MQVEYPAGRVGQVPDLNYALLKTGFVAGIAIADQPTAPVAQEAQRMFPGATWAAHCWFFNA